MIYHYFNQQLVPMAQQHLLKQFFLCKDFSDSDRLLGFSHGRGTTWFLNTQAELGINVVLRHYYRGGLFGKIVKDRYYFKSIEQTRAYQEFELLNKMHSWGLPVPRAVAIRIERTFCCYRADIMVEKIEGTQDLSKRLQKSALLEEEYYRLGQLIRRLHNHQIHHSDLNIHNILLDEQQQFWLIDFDKCYIDQGEEWKKNNLARLHRSFLKEQQRLNILFSEQQWEILLKGYNA